MALSADMPALIREPFDAQVDRLLDEAVRAVDTWSTAWCPECDVYEDGEHFTVQVSVPGVEPAAMHVMIEDQTLMIRGERKRNCDGLTWHVNEVKDGPFSCSFELPHYVDPSRSTASCKNGMLTITFPKKEEAKSRRIPIA
ncbi:Hsp20/alpha crystallin family protein [Candidatus Nitrospira bockiana]